MNIDHLKMQNLPQEIGFKDRNLHRSLSQTESVKEKVKLEFLRLPDDLTGEVISFLDIKEISSIAQTSKLLSRISVETAKRQSSFQIAKFFGLLIPSLDESFHRNQIIELAQLKEDTEGLVITNMKQVKASARRLRSKAANVLKELQETELVILNKWFKPLEPYYFDHLFDLAKIYKKIEEINSENAACFFQYYKKLADLGDIETVIQTAHEAVSVELKKYALKAVVQSQIMKGSIDEAIDIVKSISEDKIKREALSMIFEVSTTDSDIDKVVEAIKTISNDTLTRVTFEKFCHVVRSSGDVNISIAVTQKIPDNKVKAESLHEICKLLINNGHIDRAIKVANSITDIKRKSSALGDISNDLAKSGSINSSIEVARTIPDEEKKSWTLEFITKALVVSGNIDRAMGIAAEIPISSTRKRVLKGLCQSQNENLDLNCRIL